MAEREIDLTDLRGRVGQYRTLQLPGQPQCAHMGTSYLVEDLWCAVEQLRRERDEARR